MKWLVLAIWSILFLTPEAEVWIPIKLGTTDTFEFVPMFMTVEFRIIPKKALASLNVNLMTRFFDESDKMIAMTSFRFQMKGKKVIKDFLRLSTRKGHTSYDHCYDKKTLAGQVPDTLLLDLTDPSVFLINHSNSPNFAGQKSCDHWRNKLEIERIATAEIALSDTNKKASGQMNFEYRVISKYIATTVPPTTLVPPTTTPEDTSSASPTSKWVDNLVFEATEVPAASTGEICSVYPAGVIDTFDKKSEHYDLKCYHVLAARFGSPSWFIYGAFDEYGGKRSCRSVTVFVGSGALEVQRGWLINYRGQKIRYTEGKEVSIADTGCVAALKALHLTVDCRPGGFPFVIHYDGYMLAHIELFERTGNEIGLCFENSKSRVNWQIRNQNSRNQDCSISPVIPECEEAAPHCAEFEIYGDGSLARACRELTCGQTQPTSEQICSLSLAKKKKCRLLGLDVKHATTGCPQDVCLRKYFVLNAGCPQDPFFTGCPVEDYLNNGP